MPGIFGLDLGAKRAGVAYADLRLPVATPVETIAFKSREALAERLRLLIADYAVQKIVVGLPLNLQGENGPAALAVIQQVDWLKTKLALDWDFCDERLTTAEVEQVLIDADVSREDRKGLRDKLAAQRILQAYLDRPQKKGEVA